MGPNDIKILVWLGVVALVTLNGFSAGVAAGLHVWKSRMPRAGRVLAAAFTAGLIPASVLILPLIDSAEFQFDEPAAMLVGGGFLFVAGAIGSLPGAWLVTRKLAQPGDDFRTFE